MNYIKSTQNYSIYFFIFTLNFAQMNLFNLGIDFLATKISISLFFIVSLLNYKSSYSLKYFSVYLKPILLYIILLTIISYLNSSYTSNNFIDFQLFTNILIFLILLNYSRTNNKLLLKGLFVFSMSTVILSILYFLGVDVSEQLEGRYTVFGINANILALNSCISLFILLSVIFENGLQITKKRFFLFLLFPFLLILILKTGSRVAFISLILGILIFLIFIRSLGNKKKIYFILFSSLLFISFWQLFLKNSLLIERLFETVDTGDLSSRDMVWLNLFDTISNNFIFGIGKTGYVLKFGLGSPHNVIIEVLCYTGIIGLLIFLFFFFRIVQNAIKRIKYEDNLLPLVLSIPIVGMILSGQIFDQKIVWVVFAYIASSLKIKINSKNKFAKE